MKFTWVFIAAVLCLVATSFVNAADEITPIEYSCEFEDDEDLKEEGLESRCYVKCRSLGYDYGECNEEREECDCIAKENVAEATDIEPSPVAEGAGPSGPAPSTGPAPLASANDYIIPIEYECTIEESEELREVGIPTRCHVKCKSLGFESGECNEDREQCDCKNQEAE